MMVIMLNWIFGQQIRTIIHSKHINNKPFKIIYVVFNSLIAFVCWHCRPQGLWSQDQRRPRNLSQSLNLKKTVMMRICQIRQR